ncbi:MAG: cytochrome c oxidase accessory protein CcoG [Limibacillus sp.]|jgi:cytochrome c oxidase accessory protein FixG
MSEASKVEDIDVLSRKEQRAEGKVDLPLYADRVKVYPKRIWGTFRKLKSAALGLLLAIYYLAPWIRWDRGPNAPDQAILVDMPGRRLYFFWIELWPQEIYYLTGVLILGAVGIFLITSLLGRVWCGYACPQTVWTDLYLFVERKVEGDRNSRMKLDQGPLTLEKVRKKVIKHAIWLLIAFVTGGAWIMYFTDAPTLVQEFFVGQSSTAVYGFTALFAATTYLLAGWAREQVCTYMCPWPRFQAAMMDEDSLIVTYQKWRGEPRGKPSKDPAKQAELGDCVDCKLCVAVCPTGIDIRDGVQLECIGCALCIDACNSVMTKLDREPNLIAYDTEYNQAAHAAGGTPRIRLIRPRTIVYGLILLMVAGFMIMTLALRATTDISVLHDRNPLFVKLSDGSIRNGYTVKILNMRREARSYDLVIEGLSGAEVSVVGAGEVEGASAVLPAAPDDVATYKLYLSVPPGTLDSGIEDVTFVLTNQATGETVRRETVFRGPEQ